MTKWMDQTEKRIIREEKKTKSSRETLKELFAKYNVDFTKNFKITNWTKGEQEAFINGMKKLGYEGMIKKYL